MPEFAHPTLLAALMLLAAILGGYGGALLRLPRVVGYLLGGIALHLLLQVYDQVLNAANGHDLIAAADYLHGLRTLALGLIMFSIGNVFEMKHFHAVGPRVLRITAFKLCAVIVLVGAGCTAVAFVRQEHGASETVAFGLLLGVVAIATAPAATLFVLQEYEAKGPNSDAVLTMTAINNIACIVLFHVAFIVLSSVGAIDSSYSTGRWLWLDLLLTSVGSVAVGIVIGFLLSIIYVKITIADFMLIFIGILVILGAFRDTLSQELHLSYNFLLVCLFVGATFANITPDQQPFHGVLRSFAGPIFALFFVLAGFELHIGDLMHLGWVGAAYVVLRIVGKFLGAWVAIRWFHYTDYTPTLGLGMLCQAGVAIGLAAFVATTWGTLAGGVFTPHPAAKAFQSVVVGSVVLFELIGPVALKQIAVMSGEVKALTLIRRRRTPGQQTESTLQQAWEALLRTIRPSRQARPITGGPLQARDIMRSNVKVLSAKAGLDDVLHFVEASRYNHFPVVDEAGDYVGMIHYADLRHILYASQIRNLITAMDLARSGTPTATRDTPLEELFTLFQDADVGSIAVLEAPPSRRVVGMVEQRDLLLAVRGGQNEKTQVAT